MYKITVPVPAKPGKSKAVIQQSETLSIMYYVYILKSLKDEKIYVGYTSDLKKRFLQHTNGMVKSTKNRRPLVLIYYQAFLSEFDARKEEKYLKSGGNARSTLKLRISNSLL